MLRLIVRATKKMKRWVKRRFKTKPVIKILNTKEELAFLLKYIH